jgi:hypothetical protein
MDNSFSSQIAPANSILVVLPNKPLFDQVAAGLSLFLILREKKETSVYCPSPMFVEFNRLVGVNKIAQELGNKNLVLRFVDYKASDIERVSYDIENGEFRLTVIPKLGSPTPKKDQVILSYAGVSADTVILVGGTDETHFPALAGRDLESSKLIHIGNRPLTLASGKAAVSLARSASSVSEIVAALLKEEGSPVDPDIATNLIMGIEEGSNYFTSGDTTAETFENFAYLLRAGGKRYTKSGVREFVPGQVPETKPVATQPKEDINLAEVEKKELPQNPPADWLAQPKIYKGTSIS